MLLRLGCKVSHDTSDVCCHSIFRQLLLSIFKTLIMENLKIKLGLFSLLAVLASSVFLTSCEQEDIMTQTIEEFTMEAGVIYTLPKECNTMSEDELNEYLDSLTPAELSAISSTDNDLEDRGACGPWRYTGHSYCWHDSTTQCWKIYNDKSQFKKQTRWCGPPNHGYLQVRYRHVGCC